MSLDELFYKLHRDKDEIENIQVLHGQCLRLFVYKDKDTWLFEDGFRLDVNKHKEGKKDEY